MKRDWFKDQKDHYRIGELLRITKKCLERGDELHITSMEGGAEGFFISLLRREISPLLVITPDQDRAEALWEDILFFTPLEEREGVLLFPSDSSPYEDLIPLWGLYAQKMKVLRFVGEGRASLIIIPIQGLLSKVISKEALISSLIRIRLGEERVREKLLRELIFLGYSRVEVVEGRGEMSLRGGIVDIYPLDQELPVRIEFFGDQVASIRTFNLETQRSVEQVEGAIVTPLKVEGEGTLFEYFASQTFVLFDNALEAERRLDEFWEQLHKYGRKEHYLPPKSVMSVISRMQRVDIGWQGLTPQDEQIPSRITLLATSNEELRTKIRTSGLKILAQEVKQWLKEKWAVYIVVQTPGQQERFGEILEELGLQVVFRKCFPLHPLRDRGLLVIVVGDLKSGFCLPTEGLAVVTEEEIFSLKRRVGRGERSQPTLITNFEDLRIGDYVVHVDYGIGIYRGLVRLEGEGVENDYLLIAYEGKDKLYVPVDRLNLVHRYIATGDGSPKIDKLGGIFWRRTKKRVKHAVQKVAKELLEIYAARKAFQGYSFSPRDAYFKEFEAAFEYEETPDQEEAIERVMEDMEEPKPMDRLICGDVGYGKTEVAIRAAFKAALDNKQVAILVPTTVLAQQHYLTFTLRFKAYPVVVESLSRFKPPSQQREIIKRLNEGKIDIIIGTHRLLQDDVAFRDLGLLIIDEEQRFGVSHKEKLKEMRKLMDCITLSATPIPRTLQLSLLGIRDLSLINTPPPNRQAIRTYIINFHREMIREAIIKEIDRGGQVFFVHNRVKDIEGVASMLNDLVTGMRLAVAHGQMKERVLEDVMMKFVRGDIDILVCTSIIESGLDIPNANTIIINHSERFGLADLYQLRGRVGRSAQKAFAYLIVPPRRQFSREAFKRLRAIQELSELGSGFRLAIRDLEIRGAGNLFGHVQSGHIAEVGFELYNNLLEEAIRELKGEEVKERVTPEIHLPIEAFIPVEYITDDTQRLIFYKRISILEEERGIDEIKMELQDRFGQLPSQLLNLLEVISLKIWLSKFSIQKFELRDNVVIVTFASDGLISPKKVVDLIERGDGKYRLTPEMKLIYTPVAKEWRGVLEETRNILKWLT